jgi:hypothetical protein
LFEDGVAVEIVEIAAPALAATRPTCTRPTWRWRAEGEEITSGTGFGRVFGLAYWDMTAAAYGKWTSLSVHTVSVGPNVEFLIAGEMRPVGFHEAEFVSDLRPLLDFLRTTRAP